MDSIRKCDNGCNRYVDIMEKSICCDGCVNKFKHSVECFMAHEELKNKWLSSSGIINHEMNNRIMKWTQSFGNNGKNIAEIFMLGKDRSMNVLIDIIKASNKRCIMGFDYDQTISLTIKNISENTVVNELRGNSGELFDYLYQNEIPWFIFSARGISSVEAIYKDSLKYEIKHQKSHNITSKKYMVSDNQKILNQPLQQSKTQYSHPVMFNQMINGQKIYCGVYNNCISCSSEGNGETSYAYEKDYAMELAMSIYDIDPEIVIFIDDNAKNVYTVHEHFLASNRKVHFIGIIYEPFVPEKDHRDYMELIETIWKGQVVSELMMPFIGEHFMVQ